jgi:hypothetical protein
MILGGCATKYLVPTNRFMTPESQGGLFNGQVELQNTQAHQLTIITDNGNVDQGVIYSSIPRSGYMLSTSFADAVDFIWSHVGGGNSLGGAKIQFLGTSRTGKGAGHKLGAVVLFGGNDYETDDKSVVFQLDAQELMLIYGYRISDNFLPYMSIGRSTYKFSGVISSTDANLNGKEPNLQTYVNSLNSGLELDWESILGKAEFSYQQIDTSQTSKKTSMSFGFSIGFNW